MTPFHNIFLKSQDLLNSASQDLKMNVHSPPLLLPRELLGLVERLSCCFLLATLGPRGVVRAFSSCGELGPLFLASA